MPGSRFAVLAQGRRGSVPARVTTHLRMHGTRTRDQLVAATGASPATVSRSLATLQAAGLVRERPELAVGTSGRPSIPVGLDDRRFVVLGLHLGSRQITVSCSNLLGQCLRRGTLQRGTELATDMQVAARAAATLLGSLDQRIPLAVGVVGTWAGLDARPEQVRSLLAEELGLEVVVAEHLVGVAAASLRPTDRGTTAYVYARDSIAWSMAVDLDDQVVVSSIADLRHLTTDSSVRCDCGRDGCLQVAASDYDLAARAHHLGLVAAPDIDLVRKRARTGDRRSRALLVERARLLGRAVACVRDMVAPDRVVLVGEAFEADERLHSELVTAFGDATALPPIPLHLPRFESGVQAASPCAVALDQVLSDPLEAAPRTVLTRLTS